MGQELRKRDFLPISSISLFGSCETKFLKSALGELEVTPVMQAGKEMHAQLIEGLPTITREKTLEKIKSGEKCAFREVLVIDDKLKIIGRIDQLEFHGKMINGKSAGVIVDDKYPIKVYNTLPLSYKLQLASYTTAIHNSEDFSKVCAIVRAKLVCRNKDTHKVLKIFNVEEDELKSWVSQVPVVTKIAWKIFKNKKEAEHRRFDVSTNEWIECYCNRNSTEEVKEATTLNKFLK